MRFFLIASLVCIGISTQAAELRFDFSDLPASSTPTNFQSFVAGGGPLGQWQTVLDEVPSLLAPLTPEAPSVARRAVLGQLSQDTADERFPIFAFTEETFSDFTLTTRVKMVSGRAEQMGGIAFRLQDEKNFYVIRLSALGRNIRFYKVVDGIRSTPIGPEIGITNGVWYELKIQCTGNEIRAWLDGREAIPPLTDTSFRAGKIGFWTKSDSVSYFTDTVISYKPRVPLAQVLVNDLMKKYPRIQALKVSMLDGATSQPQVVASNNPKDLGQAAGKYELATLQKGEIYYAKAKDHLEMVMPLRDRNGEPIAAVRVHLNSFAGQTEQNALIRVRPIVAEMQMRVQTRAELIE